MKLPLSVSMTGFVMRSQRVSAEVAEVIHTEWMGLRYPACRRPIKNEDVCTR